MLFNGQVATGWLAAARCKHTSIDGVVICTPSLAPLASRLSPFASWFLFLSLSSRCPRNRLASWQGEPSMDPWAGLALHQQAPLLMLNAAFSDPEMLCGSPNPSAPAG